MDEGEVLGLTGLVGSGFEEIPYLLFGAEPARDGRMTIAGREYDLARMSPSAAIKAGMALIPADRQGAAGVGSLLVRDNVMLQVVDELQAVSAGPAALSQGPRGRLCISTTCVLPSRSWTSRP